MGLCVSWYTGYGSLVPNFDYKIKDVILSLLNYGRVFDIQKSLGSMPGSKEVWLRVEGVLNRQGRKNLHQY